MGISAKNVVVLSGQNFFHEIYVPKIREAHNLIMASYFPAEALEAILSAERGNVGKTDNIEVFVSDCSSFDQKYGCANLLEELKTKAPKAYENMRKIVIVWSGADPFMIDGIKSRFPDAYLLKEPNAMKVVDMISSYIQPAYSL